jgi:hypothetical protein
MRKRTRYSRKKRHHSYRRRKNSILASRYRSSIITKTNKNHSQKALNSQKVLINNPPSSGNIIKGLRDMFTPLKIYTLEDLHP